MITQYEFITESKYYKYYACSDGYVLSVKKRDYSERKLKGYLKQKKNSFILLVKINGKDYCVKHLIAKAFIKNYQGINSNVLHKNKNFMDCSVDNLLVVPKQEIASVTGALAKQMPVTVLYPDGTSKNFNSVRSAAKSLYCSYQTILDYMNGTYKTSVLDGIIIKKTEI